MKNATSVTIPSSKTAPKVLLQAKKEATAQAAEKRGPRSKMWNNGPWDDGHWANRK